MDSLDLLLKLIRIAIGTESDFSIPIAANWGEVYELSESQGVCALCADVVGGKSEELGIADDLLYSWIGQAMVQDTEYNYHVETIAKLANLYASEDMGMMVMKGYAASLMYPVPSHRCAGDVDIYLFGKGAAGDALMRKHGIVVKMNEDKHSSFVYGGIEIENHASFVNVVEHPSLAELERALEEECSVASMVEVKDAKIFVPTPMHNALFLSRHLAAHFVYVGASMRQLVEWAVFVKRYGNEVDWYRVDELAKGSGYDHFLHCLNGIVIAKFGVNSELFPEFERDEALENRVFLEIVFPRYKSEGSALYKIRRFWGNKWKYRMVYKESMIATLFRRGWAMFRSKYLPNSRSVWQR